MTTDIHIYHLYEQEELHQVHETFKLNEIVLFDEETSVHLNNLNKKKQKKSSCIRKILVSTTSQFRPETSKPTDIIFINNF